MPLVKLEGKVVHENQSTLHLYISDFSHQLFCSRILTMNIFFSHAVSGLCQCYDSCVSSVNTVTSRSGRKSLNLIFEENLKSCHVLVCQRKST